MDAGDRGEDVRRLRLVGADLLQLVGQDIEQDFRVRIGVDVAQVGAEDIRLQLPGVGEIAVVRQADAVGCVDVHRLRFRGARCAGGGVAHMSNAHVAAQSAHVALLEDLPHQAIALAQLQATVPGDHARGVLAAMLQGEQSVVDLLIDGRLADDADDAAHQSSPCGSWMSASEMPEASNR